MSQQAFGTTVLVQKNLWADTVSLKEKAARPIKLQEKGVLDCTQSYDNSSQSVHFFCDFDSEPGFAWNLIQSFSLSNKDLFKVSSVGFP